MDLADSAYKVKTEPNSNMSDQDKINLFSPYARAHGEGFSEQGNSLSDGHRCTVAPVTVDTTQPRQDPPGPDDEQGRADEYNYGVMFAANDVYTATAGDTHESVMYLSHVASSVKWYVDTTLIETDSNTDEPRMSWSIAEDASGVYVIKAVVTPTSGASYEESYTVSVTAKPPVETTPAQSFSFAPSDGLYTAVAGELHTAQVSAPEEIFSVTWYVASPGDTGRGSHVNVGSGIGDGDATTASLDYTFPSGVSGDYVFTALVYKNSDLSLMGEVSYTVSVSLPAVSVPVWSDIPDPYNLTVGDSFTLDLSSYVSGSPTLTRTAGWIPAGLRFSSGILSGTVTTVESRSLQFEATNSAGAAKSEWVQFRISAAAPAVFRPSLSLRYNSSTGSVSMTATASQPIYGADLYVRFPGDTSRYGTKIGWNPANSNRTTYALPVIYTLPSSPTSGRYKFTLRVYPFNNSGSGNAWGNPYDVFRFVTVQ